MPTNQEYYGLESEWVQPNAANIVGTNRTNQWLTVYFGPGYNIGSVVYNAGSLASGLRNNKIPKGQQLTDGYMIDDPIDSSLSYCGLGNESVYSKLAYLEYKTNMCSGSFAAAEDRDVTDFAFCQTQGSDAGFSIYNDSTSNNIDGSRSRWAPDGINGDETSIARANRNRPVTPYAQIPVRNTVFYPILRVASSIQENPKSVSGMNIVNVDWEDYMNLQNSVNYTNHPYILRITMVAYTTRYVDDIDAVTGVPGHDRAAMGSSQLSGIAVLSPSDVASGEPMDIGNPTQTLNEIYTYYNTRGKFATNAGGVMLFGYTAVGSSEADYINEPAPSPNPVNASARRLVFFPHPDAILRQAANNTNTVASGWYYLEYYDGLLDWVMEQMACFGLFFTLDRATATRGALNDDLMCLGVLEDGIGHGDWVSGKKNEEQPQWEWDTTNKSSYKPSGGGGGGRPKPEPGKNPKGLHTPGFSLAVDNGSVNYIIDQSEWSQIWDDIYGGSKNDWEELINGLALYGSNPLNAILNYRWYPFTFSPGTPEQLRLGASLVGPSTHKYGVITASAQGFKSNTASFWCGKYDEFDKNFVNIRKSKCRVWLPFYGFYELPMTMVINNTVNITFQYSIPDDMGIWEIAFGDSMWDFVECQPFVEIPITGDNSLQIAAAKAQRNLSIAMTIGGAIAGVAIGGAIAAPAIGAIGAAATETASITGGSMLGAAAANIGPLAGEGLLAGLGTGLAGASTALVGGGLKTANTVMQSALQIGNLSTNLPTHSAASDTTFLNLPLSPFIEFYKPIMQDDYDASGYKETTGIACDKWVSLNSIGDKLDSGSLLQTTGIADMDTSGMELDEINELNSIVQSGFWL